MPDWVKWVFDGFGTEIISLIIGSIVRGMIGFRLGKRRSKSSQIQRAGSNSEQYQMGSSCNSSVSANEGTVDVKSTFVQKQKAGDNSRQTQIGGQENG